MKKTISKLTLLTSLCLLGASCGGLEGDFEDARSEQAVAAPTASAGAVDQHRCWTDRDCAEDQICRGARICPPGALCGPLPDQPGVCADVRCEFEGRQYAPGDVFGACDACECLRDGTVVCRDFVCLECSSDRDCPEGFVCQPSCPPGAVCPPILEEPSYCVPR